LYDYLIVGAGLYGATFARLATDAGRKCLVIDKRSHIAGNCFDQRVEGILVNAYGGHIFHTNSEPIWQFVNRFASFTNYQHRVKVNYQGKIYSFPINLLTLNQLYGAATPGDADELLQWLKKPGAEDNFESFVKNNLGVRAYQTLFYGYTKKQWGREPRDLPASIAKRIPVRLTYDDRYFSDKFQGMPVGGYTQMVERMLEGIEVRLNDGWDGWQWNCAVQKVVYSGPIDALFDYRFGKLEYRSLRFEHETRDGDFQGCATINYTDERIPYTRIIEWKHFWPDEKHLRTVVTREYPAMGGEPFYPVEDEVNRQRYQQYRELVPDWMVVGGRLGSYQYLNMDQAIGMAMKDAKRELST
jgi:UDP-galactopyranose mutase